MNFKQYLQSAHSQNIDIKEAQKLILSNCKDIDFNKPLWRNTTSNSDAYILHGEMGNRHSINNLNYYTIIFDHFLPALGYPKRSKSIIMTNNAGKEIAEEFNDRGNLYAIFPFDGVKIGVCNTFDLLHSQSIFIGSAERYLNGWNNIFHNFGLSDNSYELFVEDINTILKNNKSKELAEIFIETKSGKTVDDILKDAYSPTALGFNLATTSTLNKYEDTERELWVGGKCVAIKYSLWEEIIGTDMKLAELKLHIPNLKPRDPNYRTLAAKKNAAGPMKDKKEDQRRGIFKHKNFKNEDL